MAVEIRELGRKIDEEAKAEKNNSDARRPSDLAMGNEDE